MAISRHPLLVVDRGRSPYLRVEVGSLRHRSSLSKDESLVLNVETDDDLPGVSATRGILLLSDSSRTGIGSETIQ